MVIIQITRVKLGKDAADSLTKTKYDQCEEWLKTWTARANCQATVAETEDVALGMANHDLFNMLKGHWIRVNPTLFEFEYSTESVRGGRFYSTFSIVSGPEPVRVP